MFVSYFNHLLFTITILLTNLFVLKFFDFSSKNFHVQRSVSCEAYVRRLRMINRHAWLATNPMPDRWTSTTSIRIWARIAIFLDKRRHHDIRQRDFSLNFDLLSGKKNSANRREADSGIQEGRQTKVDSERETNGWTYYREKDWRRIWWNRHRPTKKNRDGQIRCLNICLTNTDRHRQADRLRQTDTSRHRHIDT